MIARLRTLACRLTRQTGAPSRSLAPARPQVEQVERDETATPATVPGRAEHPTSMRYCPVFVDGETGCRWFIGRHGRFRQMYGSWCYFPTDPRTGSIVVSDPLMVAALDARVRDWRQR